MVEEPSPEPFVDAPEPIEIPSLTLTPTSKLFVDSGLGIVGFGVVDWFGSVLVDSAVSDLLTLVELDASWPTSALKPPLRLTPTSVVFVGIGTGTIGFGVVDSVDPVLIDFAVSDVPGLEAPSLTPALRAALRLTPTPLVSVGIGTGTIGFGVVDSVDPVLVDSAVSDLPGLEALDAPSLTPALRAALRLTPTPLVSVGIGTGTIGFGVFDSTGDSVPAGSDGVDSVALACAVSDLLSLEAPDASSLTPALNPALRLTPTALDFVGIGTGTIGFGVFDSTGDSVPAGLDGLDFEALACAVSDFTEIGVCSVVSLGRALPDSLVLDSVDLEALARVA